MRPNLIQQSSLAGAEESERNAKLEIGQKGKANVAEVSLEQRIKTLHAVWNGDNAGDRVKIGGCNS